jgi:5'-3' exonuclease
MTILVDLNQVMIANIMQQIGFSKKTNQGIDENLVRHMIINSLRSYRQKFHKKYGELVICCDDKNYWRKDVFPYYKSHRKKDREESSFDWNAIFSVLNQVREELKEYFPYKVIHVPRTEADDIIATICSDAGKLNEYHEDHERILILSTDKDFIQLQKYVNVDQYSPRDKKYIRSQKPHEYIREHIMRGDRGDGIPNFISSDDTFVLGKRQSRLSTKKIEEWIHKKPEDFCDEEMLRGYKRNESLIDFCQIPEWVHDSILESYYNYKENDRSILMNYFIKKKMKNLMDSLQEF